MTKNPIPLLALALLLAGTALSQEQIVFPAWQLAAAETGEPAHLYWQLPAGIDAGSVSGVSVTGTDVTGFSVLPERGIIGVGLASAAAGSLAITELTLHLGDDRHTLTVPPSEVHWLEGINRGSLLLRASQQVTGRHNALALLVQNTSADPLEITAFRYAPEAVASGRLLLATGFALLDDLGGVELPWLDGAAATTGTDHFDPESWDGLPFRHFSFSDSSVLLEPDGQAILILAAPGFIEPDLFGSQLLLGFEPWLEYRQADRNYALQPFRQGPDF